MEPVGGDGLIVERLRVVLRHGGRQGIDKAVTNTASGRTRWKTIVWSFGVSIPEIGSGTRRSLRSALDHGEVRPA